MKSLILGLATMMFSFHVFAVNNVSAGNYVAKDKGGIERFSVALAANGQVTSLKLNALVAGMPLRDTCRGSYRLQGDAVVAKVSCPSTIIQLRYGAEIDFVLNVAGATAAQMSSAAGARITVEMNEELQPGELYLFKR